MWHILNKLGELVTVSIRLEDPGGAYDTTCMPWKDEIVDCG